MAPCLECFLPQAAASLLPHWLALAGVMTMYSLSGPLVPAQETSARGTRYASSDRSVTTVAPSGIVAMTSWATATRCVSVLFASSLCLASAASGSKFLLVACHSGR